MCDLEEKTAKDLAIVSCLRCDEQDSCVPELVENNMPLYCCNCGRMGHMFVLDLINNF